MINFFYRGVKQKKIQQAKKFRVGSWVHVVDPSGEEIETLVEDLQVEKDLLLDALDPNEAPRLEKEDGNVYVFIQVPHKINHDIILFPLLLVLGKDFVMTISQKEVPFIHRFVKLRDKDDFYTTQKTKCFIQILFAVHREYYRHLAFINRKLRSIRSELKKVHIQHIEQFVEFEKILNDFTAALSPMHSMLRGLLAGKFVQLHEHDRDLVEDLSLSGGQLVDMSRSAHRYIVNIRDASSMIMTHELNRAIRMLTALTIVLSIPTIIASFFGMNVHLPLTEASWTFPFLIVVSLAAMVILYAVLLRKK